MKKRFAISTRALLISILVTWFLAIVGYVALALVARNQPKVDYSVTLFLSDEATDSQARQIRATLNRIHTASNVTYVSKEDALSEFKKLYRDQPALLEVVDAGSLPATFRVTLQESPGGLQRIVSMLQNMHGVDDVVHGPARNLQFLSTRSGWEPWRDVFGVGALIVLVPITVIALVTAWRGRNSQPGNGDTGT